MYRQTTWLFLICLLVACSDGSGQNQTAPVEPTPASTPAIAQPALPQPATVATADLKTEIPLEDDGGTFVVPVTINGAISLKFTIDSGAADVTIPSDVASTLVRAGTISAGDYIGSQTFVLADGSTIPSPEFRIRSLRVGDIVLHDVTASVTGPNGSLLLGQTFLQRLKHWAIDNDRRVLVLTAAGASGESSSSPATVIPTASVTTAGISTEAAVSPEVETSARNAVRRFFAAWSDPSDRDGETMRRFYAPVVNFYGKQISRDEIMQEKLRFARRWPTRSYIPEPDSLQVSCSASAPVCTVVGTVDWSASGGSRSSSGSARFSLSYQGGRIVEEHGRVLSRNRSED
jgi:clan AA aspartic protease (TIGR02281 family)